MAERFTHNMVKRKFEQFVKAIGQRVAESPDDHGAYVLERNTLHGYVVCKIAANNTGVSCPFGYERRKTREMWWTLHFAIELIGVMENEKL